LSAPGLPGADCSFFFMKRIALHTLGCKLNYAETAAIGKQFTAIGYTVVGIDDGADIVVINSCSVTASADRECRQLVRRSLRHSPNAFVAVVGCYAQLQAEQLAAIPGVDLVLGTQDKFSLLKFINNGKKKTHTEISVSCIGETNGFGLASSAGFEDRTRTFLKVQDGCDYSCTYCTIPLARGKSRSAVLSEIVRQAREAVELGYKEVVLTGVNVGDYGRNDGTNLLALLKQLVTIDGLFRIRISSIEPNLLSDDIINLTANSEKMCKHFHIPLQSGSPDILKLMQRRYKVTDYSKLIYKLKNKIPDIGIGVDVIVGFPGETEENFRQSYNFLRDLPISYLHVFTYSERPDTKAITMSGNVDVAVRRKRNNMLRILSDKKKNAFYSEMIGKELEILFEEPDENGMVKGFSSNYVRVSHPFSGNMTNNFSNIEVNRVEENICFGELKGIKKSIELIAS